MLTASCSKFDPTELWNSIHKLEDRVTALEELCKQLGSYMFHTPYGYTRDAADQMLLYIVNATAANEGAPEVDRLPNEFAIVDTLGEFAQERDDQEKQTYKELGIQPLHMKPGK